MVLEKLLTTSTLTRDSLNAADCTLNAFSGPKLAAKVQRLAAVSPRAGSLAKTQSSSSSVTTGTALLFLLLKDGMSPVGRGRRAARDLSPFLLCASPSWPPFQNTFRQIQTHTRVHCLNTHTAAVVPVMKCIFKLVLG